MAQEPFTSDCYADLSQDFPYLSTPYQQGDDNLDDYFVKDFAKKPWYEMAPQVQDYPGHPMQPTRRNTDLTEASGSFSPYLRRFNYSLQNLNEQHQMHGFATQPSQTSRGGSFRMTFGTSASIHFPPENVTNHYLNSDPFLQEKDSKDMGEAGAETDALEEGSDEEESKKQGILQYQSILNSKIWDEEMDGLLLKLSAQYKCHWKRIAKKFNHKKVTPSFIKMRYKELNFAAPITRRIKFTHREDLMIAKYFDKFGSNWPQLAVFFPDRTAVMLKNRYYSFIRKKNMLDLLLCRVREIEADGPPDDLKTLESEKYNECLDLKKESCQFVQKSIQQRVNGPLDMSQKRHLIFGYEGIKPAFFEQSPESVEAEKDSEIKLLRARVKSLQSLYLQTKVELDNYKK